MDYSVLRFKKMLISKLNTAGSFRCPYSFIQSFQFHIKALTIVEQLWSIIRTALFTGKNRKYLVSITFLIDLTICRFQCFEDYFVSYEYYAHRNIPMVFVQELKITNTKNQLIDIDLTLPRISDWPTAVTQTIK